MSRINLGQYPLWVILVLAFTICVGSFAIEYFVINLLFGDYFPPENKVSIIISIQACTFFV